jgi:hypothetical protein
MNCVTRYMFMNIKEDLDLPGQAVAYGWLRSYTNVVFVAH